MRYGRPPIERLSEKLREIPSGGCWEFIGARCSGGYGNIKVAGRVVTAHRLAYEFYIGEIPDDTELDHLCRNRACCNPWHLEPVSRRENVLRGASGRSFRWIEEPTCRRGHTYDETNTYITPAGYRSCRKCNNAASSRYKVRRAA